jgi:hypothetical protein
MNFFVPGIADPAEADAFYSILRRLAIEAHGRLSERRVYSVTFARRGQLQAATVGEPDASSGAPCVAIFESGGSELYYVYVEGPIRGNGHLVSSPLLVECFDG